MNTNRIHLPARRLGATIAAAVLLPVALGACSDGGSSSADATSAAKSSATGDTATMAHSLTPSDTWMKASDKGMTAAFGTLENTGSKPVVITGVSGDLGPAELHTMAKTASGMEMKRTDKFTLPAGGVVKLAPGSNHIMLMDLTKPLKAGDTEKLTVKFSDGSSTTVTFPVRAYDGAKETYSGSPTASMTSMSHSH